MRSSPTTTWSHGVRPGRSSATTPQNSHTAAQKASGPVTDQRYSVGRSATCSAPGARARTRWMKRVRLARATRAGSGVQTGPTSGASVTASAGTAGSGSGRIEARVPRVEPRHVVAWVFDGERGLRHLERAEAVHHHRELVGVLGPDAGFGPAGMRTVRDPVGMVGDAAELDPFSTHELAGGVVEHLVRVHVAVVVRRRHRLRMEVVRPGAEAADHEAVALERLVYRRRLVHPAHDGLEIHDVEGPGIEIAVPSHHVEGMVIEDDLIESVVLLDQDREVALLVVGPEPGRAADVPLAVGRPFDELTELVAVALGPAHVSPALHHQELGGLALEIEPPAEEDAGVVYQVVPPPH